MSTTTKAHREAMQKDLHELVAELLRALGPTTVQAMTGNADRSMPAKWAKPNGPKPRLKAEQQLRLGYRVYAMMRDAEGPSVAAAWLHGANPQLGEDTPITAIREQRAGAAVGAAEAFINGNSAA